MSNQKKNTIATSAPATITVPRVRWDSKLGSWKQEDLSCPLSGFAGLKDQMVATLSSKKGLKKDSPAFANENAWPVYVWVVDHLYTNLSLYAAAAKRHDENSAKAALDRAYGNLRTLLSILDPEWVVDQLWVDALMPHVGAYRKDRESGEYDFRSSADSTTFRKQLERTVANRIGEGNILTHDQLREIRKQRELAKKAAQKAAKEAAAKA